MTQQRLTRARLAQLRDLQTAPGRRQQQAFLLDGAKLVRDAIHANAPIQQILALDPDPWRDLHPSVTGISQPDAERLSDTRSPQGVFAVVHDHLPSAPDAIDTLPNDADWHIAVLDAVQDPGNAGALIRTAAAFDCRLLIAGPGGADPTHPRVARAATGAWFHIPIARSHNLTDDLRRLSARNATIAAAATDGDPLYTFPIPHRTAWIFSNEGAGLSPIPPRPCRPPHRRTHRRQRRIAQRRRRRRHHPPILPTRPDTTELTMRIVTWNVNSIRAREDRVLNWLDQHRPDVLCLQELKCTDDQFPYDGFDQLGYHVAMHGQKPTTASPSSHSTSPTTSNPPSPGPTTTRPAASPPISTAPASSPSTSPTDAPSTTPLTSTNSNG